MQVLEALPITRVTLDLPFELLVTCCDILDFKTAIGVCLIIVIILSMIGSCDGIPETGRCDLTLLISRSLKSFLVVPPPTWHSRLSKWGITLSIKSQLAIGFTSSYCVTNLPPLNGYWNSTRIFLRSNHLKVCLYSCGDWQQIRTKALASLGKILSRTVQTTSKKRYTYTKTVKMPLSCSLCNS